MLKTQKALTLKPLQISRSVLILACAGEEELGEEEEVVVFYNDFV
jgi:hypothetical protein